MYAVVGCSNCSNLWLLSDPDGQDRAECPRCGTSHRTERLRRLAETRDRDAAVEARARLLADRAGAGESFSDVPHVSELEERLDDAGVTDDEYLAQSGIDPETVASATTSDQATRSREEIVRAALRAGEHAVSAEDVLAYADDRGVPPEAAREILRRLRRAGDVAKSDDGYRLL